MSEHTPAPTASRGVYGFAMYLAFKLLFIIYLIWAVVPGQYFKDIGITCLPQQCWAVLVPIILILALLLFAFIVYPSLGGLMTPNFDDLRTIEDSTRLRKDGIASFGSMNLGNECCCTDKSKCSKISCDKSELDCMAVPPLKDLDIWDVSKHLYYNK